ncbi:MAG: serine/threonine-protein kinase [Polyangiaceae bacterium]|jgi:serine/threonine-protein kinase
MATCPVCRVHYPDDVAHCTSDGERLLPDEAFSGADVDLAAGAMVGEFRIESRIGQGAFGTVYKATHPVIGKAAAVKVLSRQWSSNPQMVSRFIAEARAVNQIRHKNIIDIFAFGVLPDGRQYYVMELLDGMPFDHFIRERGRVPPETALGILRQVARALDAAHAQGIVHRDLKPENVYLVFDEDEGVFPKLLDFGIAKLLGEETTAHQTRPGTPMGTPSYMSPEQCRGKVVDHRTDVYSLGVMTHEVLAGRPPFDGDSVMEVLVKHMSVAAPRMTAHAPELPAALDEPVLQMLAKEPEERPSSAGLAIEALSAAAREAGLAVGSSAGAHVPSRPVARLSAPERAQLARAETLVGGAGEAGRTFMPAERDVGSRPRRRALLVAVVAAVSVLAGAAAVVLVAQSHAPVSASAAVSASAPAPASASAPAPASASASASALSPSVAVTVESNVAGASVWLGGKRLGDASGPLALPRGDQGVTLVVKADGYAPSSVDVVPTGDVVVAVKLVKLAAAPSGSTRRVSKDLENPF